MIGAAQSIQKRYPEYFSGDPAFVQLAKDASDEEKREYFRQLEHARETGDWSGLRVDGGSPPTTFILRPMPGEAFREIAARIEAGEKAITLAPVGFRACIVKIENCGGIGEEIRRTRDPRLGEIATVTVTNELDAIHPDVVTELGLLCITRGTQGLSPKR